MAVLYKTPLFWISVLSGVFLATLGANDFRVYYEAAQNFLTSGWAHIYEPNSLVPFKYHPVFVLGFMPFGLLPWITAKVLWGALNSYFIYEAGIRFSKRFSISVSQYTLGVFFVIHAMTWQLKFANVTFFILWLLALCLSDKEKIAAIASAILILLKPFFLPILLLQPLFKKNTLLAKTSLTILALSLLPIIFGGSASLFEAWFAVLLDPSHAHNYGKNDNQTLYALLYRNKEFFSIEIVWLIGCIISGLLWIKTAITKQYNFALLAMIPFVLFAAPMSWIHHQIWLWPLAAALLGAPYWLLAIWWLLLNGTGDLFLGRYFFVAVHQCGVPLLAFLLIQLLCLKNTSYNR